MSIRQAPPLTATRSVVDAPGQRTRKWAALAVLMLPVLLISVDNTVLNFALPAISRALEPSGTGLLWIIDVYPLVMAGLLVSMGSLGDRIGRRRLLLIGSIGFVVVSAAAAFAPTTGFLIAARGILGFFGAMLMPSTMSLLRNIFVDRNQRRLAIAIWASGFAVGSALGPLVGGVLLEHFWWGAVFLLAIPVLVPLVALAPMLIPESRDPNPGQVDVASILLSLAALAPFVYGIKSLATEGNPAIGLSALTVGVVAGVFFVVRQLRRENPMIDMRLFRHGAFSGAVTINLLSVVALVGFLFFVSLHLQLVLDLSPIDASYVLLPGLLAMIAATFIVVPVSRRVRPGIVVPAALLLSAAAYGIIALSGGRAPTVSLLVAFVILGVGIGAAETVSNELIIASAPADKAGAASAVSETAYEVGAVLGTAVLGTILTASYRAAITLPQGLTAAAAHAARETLGGAVTVAGTLPHPVAAELLRSARAAFDSGVAVTSVIGVALMLVAATLAAIMLRRVTVGA